MSNLPGHIELFKRTTYQVTMDKNEFMKDKEKPKHGRGRRHLRLIDNLKADREVTRAIKGESSYES